MTSRHLMHVGIAKKVQCVKGGSAFFSDPDATYQYLVTSHSQQPADTREVRSHARTTERHG